MEKYFLPLFAIFFSYLLCGENNDWIRIDEAQKVLQVGFRTYHNPATRQKVELLAAIHVGAPSYYELINEIIKDKTLIYESKGDDIAEAIAFKDGFDTLSSEYKNAYYHVDDGIYSFLNRKLNLSYQNLVVDYKHAKKLFHGDVRGETSSPSDPFDKKTPRVWLEDIVNRKYQDFFHQSPQEGTSLLERAQKISAENDKNMNSDLAAMSREKIARLIFAEFGAAGQTEEFKEEWITNRNKKAIETIDALLGSEQEFVVLYGASHMDTFVEHLTTNKGFQLSHSRFVNVIYFGSP